MEQKILTARSASSLNTAIAKAQEEGFEPVGSHTCVEIIHQCQYDGKQHQRTLIDVEYAQTVRKA